MANGKRDGWIKCRFCFYSVPEVLDRGRFKGKSGNIVLREHVEEAHWDRLTDKEKEALWSAEDLNSN